MVTPVMINVHGRVSTRADLHVTRRHLDKLENSIWTAMSHIVRLDGEVLETGLGHRALKSDIQRDDDLNNMRRLRPSTMASAYEAFEDFKEG